MNFLVKPRLVLAAAALLPASLAYSQAKPADAAKTATRVVSENCPHSRRHPDLSGTWTFGIDLPHGDLVKIVDGKETRDPLRSERAPPREQ